MRLSSPRTRLALLVATALCSVAGAPESRSQDVTAYRVIVNAANPTTKVARVEAARIFLKQSSKWADGKPAVPVDQSTVSQVRIAFSKGVLGQSVDSIQQYWNRQIYSGRGVPPLVKSNDGEIVAFVEGNTGAVGYVSGAAKLTTGVKEIAIE